MFAILTATLVGVTFHAWRLDNEKRDVPLPVCSAACAAWGPLAP